MTTPNKLNEFNHAEDPARMLLDRLGWGRTLSLGGNRDG